MLTEDYLVFIDETGDHSLTSVDPQYPIFALGAVVCTRDSYIYEINPIFDELKYRYWKKRHVIFHSTDIRRNKDDFNILRNRELRDAFFKDLNLCMENSPFELIISAINKNELNEQYVDPINPYILTLEFILERLYFLIGQNGANCILIAESRNDYDNKKLLEVFERFKQTGTKYKTSDQLQFIKRLIFIKKEENEIGHQIADLCLYPSARSLLTNIPHKSMTVIYPKLYKNQYGKVEGYGLKYFPSSIDHELLRLLKGQHL